MAIPAGCNDNIFINAATPGYVPVPWDDTNGRYALSPLPPFPYWIVTPTGSPPTSFLFQLFTAAGQHMDFTYTGGGTNWTLTSAQAFGGAREFGINWWKSFNTAFNAEETGSQFQNYLGLTSIDEFQNREFDPFQF